MSLLTEKPINEGVLVFAMYLDLYKRTQNQELKDALEYQFIRVLKQ